MGMQRRKFFSLFVGAASWPLVARAQNQTNTNRDSNRQVGQVGAVQGISTVERANAAPSTLKVSEAICKKDILQTAADASLAITFNDETTLSLSANARIVVDEFVYVENGKRNNAVINVARGMVAFVAGLAARTGGMTILTPTATLGIRGTTGIVDVPDNAAVGAAESKIKLYPDADGRVGRIEVFTPQGGQLGTLTQASSAFAIRRGLGGRFAAIPFQIPPQEAARDRNVVRRLFASHNIGRQMMIQRQQLRAPSRQLPSNQRPNNLPRPRELAPQNPGPNLQPKGNSGPPPQDGFREKLPKVNPFAPKKNELIR